MKRFFYSDFIGIVKSVIDSTEQQLGLHTEAEFTHFFTEAIAGMLIDEFTDKDGHDPDKVAGYLSLVLNNSLPSILRNAPKGLR